MARDEQLKERWDAVVKLLSDRFADGETLDLDAIIYLVGLQELGQLHREFKKDEKLNLMHIAICRLLEPFGYYRFDYFDDDGCCSASRGANDAMGKTGRRKKGHLVVR